MSATTLSAPVSGGTAAGCAVETLALTLWAEAAARPVRAIEALAALVVNRARLAAADAGARARFAPGGEAGVAWPDLLGRACRAPFLFACWNPRHPRHAALGAARAADRVGGTAANARSRAPAGQITAPPGDPALAICRRIAARAAGGGLPDPTGGATHWHKEDALPGWALGQVPVAEIGGLVFYRLAG